MKLQTNGRHTEMNRVPAVFRQEISGKQKGQMEGIGSSAHFYLHPGVFWVIIEKSKDHPGAR